jgi:hypothetical protein
MEPLMRSAAAALIMLCATLVPGLASADIDGFTVNDIEGLDGLSLNDRFGTRPSDDEHQINFDDCVEYNGEAGFTSGSGTEDGDATGDSTADAVSGDTTASSSGTTGSGTDLPTARYVHFEVSMVQPLLSDNWYYAVKIGACDSGGGLSDTETDTCRYVQQRKKLDSFLSIEFDVNVRYLLGTLEINNSRQTLCQDKLNTTSEVRVVFLIERENDTTSKSGHEISIQYDYKAPSPPTELVADAGEGNAHLSWSDRDNSTEAEVRYQVYWASEPFTYETKSVAKTEDTVKTASDQVTGLEKDTTYYFRVLAIDDFDNESTFSDQAVATPVAVNDFFEEYLAQGGRERGGFCSASSRGDLAGASVAALLLLLLVGLRRLRVLGLSLLLLTMMVPVAYAVEKDSPRNWTVNFRFGTYMPEIDSEFAAGVVTPYKRLFDNESLWLWRSEIGYLVTDVPGSVFLTLEAGFGRISGHGLEVETNEASGDATRMHFVPLSLGVMYQMDLLAHRYGFPLVPYGRGGFGYTIWWITDGLGEVPSPATHSGDESDGSGATMGFYYGGGLRLLLDFMAPGMAYTFDREMGFNDSYVFCDLTRYRLDDFSGGDSFILSDTQFSFGLGFDF